MMVNTTHERCLPRVRIKARIALMMKVWATAKISTVAHSNADHDPRQDDENRGQTEPGDGREVPGEAQGLTGEGVVAEESSEDRICSSRRRMMIAFAEPGVGDADCDRGQDGRRISRMVILPPPHRGRNGCGPSRPWRVHPVMTSSMIGRNASILSMVSTISMMTGRSAESRRNLAVWSRLRPPKPSMPRSDGRPRQPDPSRLAHDPLIEGLAFVAVALADEDPQQMSVFRKRHGPPHQES